jgi:hypothetical protein
MKPLTLIKTIHTLIWLFFNVVIFYLLYAVVINRIDKWVWIAVGLVAMEMAVLALNKMKCPLTNMAERHTENRQPNFDIYLPLWLAQHNKAIYGTLFLAAILLLCYRLL